MALLDHEPEWVRNAVGYEVYLRSFCDGTGDGIGDLIGLRERLPYLSDLGVDMVWITPCYPSPGFDHGYDVSDYLGVDEVFGGMDALQAVLDDAHGLGMRVILDIVPNHSSHRHPWFQQAVADVSSPTRDWYVWADGHDGGPPNNWRSHFGGPAWTRDPTSGQWYLHLFLPEQPDLNWRNPGVHAAFEQILSTWFRRGVDGFRIDVAHALYKDPELRDNPVPPGTDLDALPGREAHGVMEHVHDQDQPEVVDLYRTWRRLAEQYDALLLGEVYLSDPERIGRYVEEGALHRAFCFTALQTTWDADEIRRTLQLAVASGRGRFAWPMSSHDDPRAATRFGGGEVGSRRQLAYLALLLTLPGIPFLYQGDELGLEDGQLPPGIAADPVATRNAGTAGRDGTRTPMPWRDTPGFGFTSGTPWLPFGTNHTARDTAEAQQGDPVSPLERTRALLRARRELDTMLATDEVTWLDAVAAAIVLQRGDVVTAMNVSGRTVTVPLPGAGRLVAASDGGATVEATTLQLPADTTAWVRVPTSPAG